MICFCKSLYVYKIFHIDNINSNFKSLQNFYYSFILPVIEIFKKNILY